MKLPDSDAVAQWCQRVTEEHQQYEQDWATMWSQVIAMVTHLANGDTEAAIRAGEAACDAEYALWLECEHTGQLCERLGLPIAEEGEGEREAEAE